MALVRFSSVPQMKVAVTNSGSYFFTPGAMRFFNSKVETGIIAGHYFITSERMETSMPKLYTVRYFTQSDAGKRMEDETVGEFQEHASLSDAREALTAHLSDVEACECSASYREGAPHTPGCPADTGEREL